MARRRITASHWGAGIARMDGEQIAAIEPHPDDPDPSRINENIAASLRGRARILRPAIRESWLEHGPGSGRGERGAEPFVEVSWDRALDLVASEIERVRSSHGNEAIFGGSYGWASAGRFHHAQSQLKRFLNCCGGFTSSVGNYSYNAALVLMPHIVGEFRQSLRDATRWRVIAEHGRLVVMFGGMALRNAQVSGGGVAQHRLRDELRACAGAGVRFVNLSPLRTDAMAELGAEWLAPRPGTDVAVMMGIAHTLLTEGLHDTVFLERYTTGFDRLEAYLTGATDGEPKSAEWAAGLSGLPAERIRTLAREMAAGPTLITLAAGVQRTDWGEQPLWMTVALAAMLGQIGLPGGGYGIAYAADAAIGTMDRPLRWPSLPQGVNPVERFIPVAMIADLLLKPGAAFDWNGQRLSFPETRIVWWAGGNPFHHHQDLNRLRRAFQRPETVIVNEINWTATARHADIVLPVAAAQERTDFGAGNQDNALIPMPKLAEPPGEARTEYALYCALEERLGLGSAYSLGRSEEDWLRALWGDLVQSAASEGTDLPDWESFIQGGIIELPDRSPDKVYLAEYRANRAAHPVATPSGRIELFSEAIHGFGYADCPGHAVWQAPRDWPRRERFPLHLISGQPETRLHSQYDNGDFSRSRKVAGREPVLIHPDDARGARDRRWRFGDALERSRPVPRWRSADRCHCTGRRLSLDRRLVRSRPGRPGSS